MVLWQQPRRKIIDCDRSIAYITGTKSWINFHDTDRTFRNGKIHKKICTNIAVKRTQRDRDLGGDGLDL